MSLKAKLEAVIYAAEEPVTLAQFAVIFAEEAVSWKAEQDARSNLSFRRASQLPKRMRDIPDSTLELVELVAVVVVEAETAVSAEQDESETDNVTEAEPSVAVAVADVEAEAKRAEKKRDR